MSDKKPGTLKPIKPGTWVSGQSGNPKGRQKGVRTVAMVKNDLELAVREALSPSQVIKIVNRVVETAINDPDPKVWQPMAKLVVDMGISKASVHELSHQSGAITIIIENATLAAQKLQEQPIVEAEYNEISSEENQ